jgi:hypothetical protein
MSSRWFRFYADAMRNPKVARLSDKQFRLWVQLLSVAAESDGKIPCIDDLKHVLNRRLDHLLTGVKELLSVGLIDSLGDGYEPHNWSKFQYKSDTSNDRVAKHRAKRNVTVTPPETETESEDNTSVLSSAQAREPKSKREVISKVPMTVDWQPAPLPETLSALTELWPPGRLAREVDQFRDYWLDRTDKRPGWDRSFHNRIRDIHDRVMKDNRNGNGTNNYQTDAGTNDPVVQAIIARKAQRAGEQQRKFIADDSGWAEDGRDSSRFL